MNGAIRKAWYLPNLEEVRILKNTKRARNDGGYIDAYFRQDLYIRDRGVMYELVSRLLSGEYYFEPTIQGNFSGYWVLARNKFYRENPELRFGEGVTASHGISKDFTDTLLRLFEECKERKSLDDICDKYFPYFKGRLSVYTNDGKISLSNLLNKRFIVDGGLYGQNTNLLYTKTYFNLGYVIYLVESGLIKLLGDFCFKEVI